MKRKWPSRPGTWARRRRRTPVHWVRDVFDGGTIAQDGTQTVEALSLLEYDDYEPSTTTVQHDVIVKRAVVDVALCAVPLINALGTLALATFIRYALVVLDNEDTDGSLLTAAQGSLLQTSRVLHTGVVNMSVLSPQNTSVTERELVASGPKIEVDWKGGCKLRPDDILFFLMQLVFPVTDVSPYVILDYAASSSILVNLKG